MTEVIDLGSMSVPFSIQSSVLSQSVTLFRLDITKYKSEVCLFWQILSCG